MKWKKMKQAQAVATQIKDEKLLGKNHKFHCFIKIINYHNVYDIKQPTTAVG